MIDPDRQLCEVRRLDIVSRIVPLFRSVIVCLLLLPGLPAPALAQSSPGGSERSSLSCLPAGERLPLTTPQRSESAPMTIDSEEFQAPDNAPLRFAENVRVEHQDQVLTTRELLYDRQTGRIDLPSWLTYQDRVMHLRAASGWVETERKRGRFEQIDYRFARGEGSGSADVIELLSETRAEVERFDFTTCDPERPDWQLKAGRVDLDMDKGRGVARHARLEFKGVPILYSPWLSFPLDDRRKTGLLYPRLGVSSNDGLDLSIPWYWNIAPKQDATLTPRWIQDRGFLLATEYRFLTDGQRGQVEFEWLPDDRKKDRDRYFGQFNYTAGLAANWRFNADLKRASDDDYFRDFGGDLSDAAVQFLRSSAALQGSGSGWSLEMMADVFQVLDEAVLDAREPYRRLPRVLLNIDRPVFKGVEFRLDSELVHFDRDQGVTGLRLDAHPRLRYNWLRPYGFLRPELGLRATGYALDGVEADADRPTRTTPIVSLDGGLIFERTTSGGRIQTLEPRVFYLYVPWRDQQNLPLFDTRELTFGFSQLFSPNRFSGPDRQGDANQLTTAVTSRLLSPKDGQSVLDFSLGQIFYFRDLEVGLDGSAARTEGTSATLAEISWRPARALAVSAGLQWDFNERETEVAQLGLSYRGTGARQAVFGYRFRRDRVDQVDFRLRWPLSANLNLIGRVNYSFQENEALELLAGFEYESCCWALRLMGREFIRSRESETRTAVFLELHLKGLGSLGRRPYALFADQRY